MGKCAFTLCKDLHKALDALNDFKSYNIGVFSTLFPRWRELIGNIILSVGCPALYDAMVREYNGKYYIMFDYF